MQRRIAAQKGLPKPTAEKKVVSPYADPARIDFRPFYYTHEREYRRGREQ